MKLKIQNSIYTFITEKHSKNSDKIKFPRISLIIKKGVAYKQFAQE
jgi:hypothetical protein